MLAATVLFFFCQSFWCGEVFNPDIYLGGVVKDKETKQPLSDIEIWVNRNENPVITDEAGKFGFKEEIDSEKFKLHFRDTRKEPVYADWDTLVSTNQEKFLVDIYLQKLN